MQPPREYRESLEKGDGISVLLGSAWHLVLTAAAIVEITVKYSESIISL